MKDALSACTVSQDNHLRALVFALVAAQYVHTSAEHAQTMLATAETLASGMGGGMKKVKDGNLSEIGGRNGEFGNVFLRLWVGEQSVGMLDRVFQGVLTEIVIRTPEATWRREGRREASKAE